MKEPDFIVSLGTGEPLPNGTSIVKKASRSVWSNGIIPRLCRLSWEKMRDGKVRQAIRGRAGYHRLQVTLGGTEPRLDDTQSFPLLKSTARDDESLSAAIDSVARCAVASLFYFELDAIPQRLEGTLQGVGRILCALRPKDPAFEQLLSQLSRSSARFLLNGTPVAGAVEPCCFDKDGSFRKTIDLNVPDGFTICLEQSGSPPQNIARSPFLIKDLVVAQGLDASFGRPDHRKRKSATAFGYLPDKRRRMW